MARGEVGSPAVAQRLDEMFLTITELPVDTLLEQEFLASEAARFNDLVSARSVRLDFVDQGVPGVLWLALIVGAIVTIGFATIFGLRSTRLAHRDHRQPCHDDRRACCSSRSPSATSTRARWLFSPIRLSGC